MPTATGDRRARGGLLERAADDVHADGAHLLLEGLQPQAPAGAGAGRLDGRLHDDRLPAQPVQPGDRRHIFNAVYSINLPSPLHGNKILAGAVNGWQLSGITQWQSGTNLTGNSVNQNYSMQLNGAIIPGTENIVDPNGGANGIPINNQSITGTNAIQLSPILTCDPTKGLASHQFVNGNCFAAPTTPGVNGPTVLPAIYGPAFFNSDLGIFKNFQIKEKMKLQFRVQAQNFLNHPLWSFPNQNNLTLQFNQASPGSSSIPQTNQNFGYTQFKQGQRIVQFVVKFYF